MNKEVNKEVEYFLKKKSVDEIDVQNLKNQAGDVINNPTRAQIDNVVITSRFANYGRNVHTVEGMVDVVNLIVKHIKPFDSTNQFVVNRTEPNTLTNWMKE